MSAKNYFIAEGCFNIYLAKKIKNPHIMSEDRRVLTDEECMQIAHFYLRKKCNELKTNQIIIKDGDNNPIFEMKLYKSNEEI